MTSRTCFGIGSLALVFTLSCCMVGGSEMASEPALIEAEYVVADEDELAASDFGYDETLALADGAGYAPPDGRDPFLALDLAGADDAPEEATAAPTRPTLKGGPLYAQADDDDSADECEDPTPEEDDIDLQKVAKDLTQAKKPKDRVEIQQRVIDENLDDADDLNDELAAILEELRREQGLKEEEAYVSPVQQVVEPILEEEDIAANPAYYQQQIQEILEEPERVPPTDEDDEEPTPQDQDQDQNDRTP